MKQDVRAASGGLEFLFYFWREMSVVKKLKRGKLWLTLAASCLCFALIAFLGVRNGGAWLASSGKVSAFGIEAAAEQLPYASYEIYKYDVLTDRCVAVGEENGLDLSALQMNRYDTLLVSRNRYSSVIVRIDIGGGEIEKEGSLTLTFTRDPLMSADHGMSLSSSLLRFSAFTDTEMTEELSLGGSTAFYNSFCEKYYSEVTEYPNDNSTSHSKTFVSAKVSDGGYHTSYTDEISLSLDYTSDDFVTVEGQELLRVYLYITYDPLLVEKCISENVGGSLDVENDLSLISIDFGE